MKREIRAYNLRYSNGKAKALMAIAVMTLAIAIILLIACKLLQETENNDKEKALQGQSIESGNAYIIINDNIPYYTDDDKTTEGFEYYSDLDRYGRCGVAFANICRELMPTEERGAIGHIKPTGWIQNKYPGVVDSSPPYLYNRCHLIAFCLTGENANEKNLITGTRYMNVEGMFPFEEKVASYVETTGNHVLYRVTPDFREKNLLANGVLLEACSVEDNGKGICFCVYCFNVQPGIEIDYTTGGNRKVE